MNSVRGHVRVEFDAVIARVTIVNAGKLNAMSRAMWAELKQAFERVHASSECRAAVIAGEGGNFCAGGDISEYPGFRFDEKQLAHFHEKEVWPGLRALLECDVPIVAQVEGACMGAGLEIASCCDIRIASESAKFGAPIAKLGFPMAPREAAVVAHAVGDATSREILLEAAVIGAAEMKSRGFVQRVVADAQVPAAANESVQRMAELSPQAARLNKQSLRALAAAAMNLEVTGAYRYADSSEHREGIAAFIEKRKPRFREPT
jgi:enoyl-CoA hydratase/carnithine racemase